MQLENYKDRETNYYRHLKLNAAHKKEIFGIDTTFDSQMNSTPKIIVQDPIQGNLIMTEQEYIEKYLLKEKV